MATKCPYVPEITAEFGKTITNEEIDREFQAIEETFNCFAAAIGSELNQEDRIYDHGVIDNSYTIQPGFGVIHYMELQGNTELTVAEPDGEDDPRLITLIIANAGSIATDNYGRFNFKAGATWAHDRDDPMDGKPWNMYANLDGSTNGTQYPGFYGCAVQCIHDGVGWVHLSFARHHLDIFSALNPKDIYDWR
jgi:hypothetical protein